MSPFTSVGNSNKISFQCAGFYAKERKFCSDSIYILQLSTSRNNILKEETKTVIVIATINFSSKLHICARLATNKKENSYLVK